MVETIKRGALLLVWDGRNSQALPAQATRDFQAAVMEFQGELVIDLAEATGNVNFTLPIIDVGNTGGFEWSQ